MQVTNIGALFVDGCIRILCTIMYQNNKYMQLCSKHQEKFRKNELYFHVEVV